MYLLLNAFLFMKLRFMKLLLESGVYWLTCCCTCESIWPSREIHSQETWRRRFLLCNRRKCKVCQCTLNRIYQSLVECILIFDIVPCSEHLSEARQSFPKSLNFELLSLLIKIFHGSHFLKPACDLGTQQIFLFLIQSWKSSTCFSFYIVPLGFLWKCHILVCPILNVTCFVFNVPILHLQARTHFCTKTVNNKVFSLFYDLTAWYLKIYCKWENMCWQ